MDQNSYKQKTLEDQLGKQQKRIDLTNQFGSRQQKKILVQKLLLNYTMRQLVLLKYKKHIYMQQINQQYTMTTLLVVV